MKQSITLNRLGSSEEISGRMHESNEFLSFSVRYNKLLNTLLKLLLIPVLSMLSMTLSAQITFSAGGIYYITTGTNTVAVNKPFTPSQYYGVKVIPPTVSNNNISYTVTTIGERAFSDCIDLTDIKLPISLTMLSDYCFANCSSLLSINIPNSVDSIGKGAFQGCDQLYEISLPQKIRSISSNLFQGCSYLQTVNLPPNINSIGIRAFNKCWRLQSIIIPYGVSAIFQEAFEDSGLYEIHLPATLKYIGSDSFSLTQLRNVYVYATPPNLDLEFSSTAQIYVPKGYLNEYLTAPNWRKIAPNNIREMDVLPGAIFTNAGINYKIKENNYVEVTAGNYTGNISIPRVVYYYGLSYTVSSIADSAFYNCTSLTSISIPFTVTSIGNHAFHACIGLKNVNFPTYSFNPEYYIKFSLLNSIGNYAFANCIILTEITLPPSVSSIGNYAFSGDHALKTINALPHDPPILGEFESINNELSAHSVFLDVNKNACKLYTPTGSKNLYKDALGWKDFSNMAEPVTLNPGSIFLVDNINYLVTEQSSVSVTKGGLYHDTISVPATVSYQGSVFNVTEIDTRAFADSTNLTCINLPISLTTIGYEAFKNCVGLTKIKLPDSLDSIADYAFNNCSNLSDSLQLPQSLKYIGILSFANCNQLTGNLTIPNSVQTIGLGAFQTCTGFKGQLTLPSIISKIPVNAFRSCQFTGSLTIPSSVTSIDQSAFIGNQFTGNLQIPSSVVAIGSEAFSGCNRFTSLNIPASVTSIGTFAFYFCSGLISVCDYNPTPLTLNKNAFGGVDQSICILTVPSGTKALYASADVWKDFKTINEIGQNNTDGATFAYNGINYLITSDNTVMVVSGNYSGNISIPQTVNNNSKDYQVTDIKEYAFSNNPNLTNVSLPSSVMHVGAGAFYKCSGLTGVILPASLATLDDFTFAYCNNLLTVNIPSTVRVIGNAVFQGCTNLNKVNIPSGVLLLGDQVFSGCSSISTVNIPGTINFLGDGVFEGCSSNGYIFGMQPSFVC